MAAVFPSIIRKRFTVLNALVIRDIMARYGHGNLGFLWLLVEPILLILGVAAIWTITVGSTKHGIRVVPLCLTGYSVLTLWRHLVSNSTHLLRANLELLYHRAVTPIDVVVARYLSEIFGVLTAFFLVYISLLLVDGTEPIHDYMILLGGWFLMSFFSVGVGLIIASLTELTHAVERIVQPIMYLLLPFSGVFVMVAWLPSKYRVLMEYVPMVNGTEMFRAGYFGPSVPTYYDAGYLLVCGIFINLVGITLFVKARNSIEG